MDGFTDVDLPLLLPIHLSADNLVFHLGVSPLSELRRTVSCYELPDKNRVVVQEEDIFFLFLFFLLV
jgi:hypothetical protein